jgi:hypothetical protein
MQHVGGGGNEKGRRVHETDVRVYLRVYQFVCIKIKDK